MIIYSVTVTIDQEIEEEWLQWMISKHIPDVLNTGYFSNGTMQLLLDPEPEEGTVTFNIQYECESIEVYESYQANAASALQVEHTERYKGRFVAFRTILKRMGTLKVKTPE